MFETLMMKATTLCHKAKSLRQNNSVLRLPQHLHPPTPSKNISTHFVANHTDSSHITDSCFCHHYPSPNLPSYENVILRGAYLSSVSYRNKIPNWVSERLNQSTVGGRVNRSSSKFTSDPLVPEMWRSQNDDFWDSGYSRGHMAAAAAHKDSQEHMDQTFFLSANILPQEQSNNGCDWLRLERLSLRLARSCEEVYVISGPLWLPDSTSILELKNLDPTCMGAATGASDKTAQNETKCEHPKKRRVSYDVVGPRQVAAPTHLFKVIVAVQPINTELLPFEIAMKNRTRKSRWQPKPEEMALSLKERTKMPIVSLGAFIMPNRPQKEYLSLPSFKVPISTVEAFSGLNFSGMVDYCHRVTEKGSVERDETGCVLHEHGGTSTIARRLAAAVKGLANRFRSPNAPEQKGWNPSVCDRASFLRSIPLCGDDGERCADSFVKSDKLIASSQLLGLIELSEDLAALNDVWVEVEKGGAHKDFFLKKAFERRCSEFGDESSEVPMKEKE